ncbi:hypothetical protein BT96DRAFT_1008090 [Gymnopus androsaceus JB14]|uniref:Uncharacterized protein n=1 Tax=Gymnopus androsaceus JB14 TaxID=1447944 RepID=A0A6A4GFU9_9AGAR|nr:hypothetical protein BT96DRAFT_1008090 [Gymnopus androsaceus JB14]
MVGRIESVKQAALRGRKRASKSKRGKPKANHQTNDRVHVEGDFEAVHTRDGRLDLRGVPVASQRLPQKGRITWMAQKGWNAEEIREHGLGDHRHGSLMDAHDEGIDGVNIDVMNAVPTKRNTKRKMNQPRMAREALYRLSG